MRHRGKMDRGVVVLEGERPADGTWVDVVPATIPSESLTDHPALGIWKDRNDLPNDALQASKTLRERLMRPTDAR